VPAINGCAIVMDDVFGDENEESAYPNRLGSWFGALPSNGIRKIAVELSGFEPLTFCAPS
jgi:hypothetical protein